VAGGDGLATQGADSEEIKGNRELLGLRRPPSQIVSIHGPNATARGDRVAFQDYRPGRFRLLLFLSTLPPTFATGYMYVCHPLSLSLSLSLFTTRLLTA